VAGVGSRHEAKDTCDRRAHVPSFDPTGIVKALRVHVTIVNDPKKLAELGAELQRRQHGLSAKDAKLRLAWAGCRSKLGEIRLR